ncbi:methionyl-tRNA formyltransferase [Natronospira bacteriovora]|uniref:Methionyl-tRNA formyltransferase n=1 Tax=Natronospira bacteriovora TaxID=3069753 RepID=A0ABU0WA33_9GAMM|nr:methionyl-tRNA formyltransferase [Natronospira sp. AB-CW4]MDQ2070897.1 methionyl-tRNA formyltransferase [Natronospira sp. AB-CW4]
MAGSEQRPGGLRIVYAGTPGFAVPALEALADSGHQVVAVFTQPDRPAGRGRKPQPSPVKQFALERGIPVHQPERLDEAARETLAGLTPDLMVVTAYGLILPQAVLDLPRLGCINIHASLLPRWRGAAPIQRAIEAGDAETGVAIMRMEAGLDTGPVLLERRIEIGERETAGELHDRLAALGGNAILDAVDGLATGRVKARAQPESGVTYARKLHKSEADIDWQQSALTIDRRVRAFSPWPVAQTRWQDKQLRVHAARPVMEASGTAGEVLKVDRDGVLVACGEGALRLERVQLPGKRPISGSDFANAGVQPGQRLGNAA